MPTNIEVTADGNRPIEEMREILDGLGYDEGSVEQIDVSLTVNLSGGGSSQGGHDRGDLTPGTVDHHVLSYLYVMDLDSEEETLRSPDAEREIPEVGSPASSLSRAYRAYGLVDRKRSARGNGTSYAYWINEDGIEYIEEHGVHPHYEDEED